MCGASFYDAPLFKFKVMEYSIKHFKSESIQSDPLQISCYSEIVNNDSILFVTGVQNSYLPNIWSSLLCEEFKKTPSNFIRKSWSDLSFLNNIRSRFSNEVSKFKRTLSDEKLFILDNQYTKNPKSGSTFISIQIENKKIKYNILGDNFLFLYSKHTKKIHAYCSMINDNGTLDLSQPCHCLYNDLSFIGSPIIGEKSSKDCICFIMSRDLAIWFINTYKSDQAQTINLLLSLDSKDEYHKFLRKIQFQQSFNKVPFNKDTADLVIIQRDDKKTDILKLLNFTNLFSKIKQYRKSIVIFMAIISLIICFFGIIRGCSHDKHTSNDSVHVSAEENTSQPIIETKTIVQDDFDYYHNQLNNDKLSFCEVSKMMEKAKEEKLIEINKNLYDTLSVYFEFVNLYKEQKDCYLRKAISTMFKSPGNGQYKIFDNLGNEILSTDLSNGNITYLREIHRRMIIELFVGKYSNEGRTIIEHDVNTKMDNYRKAINSRFNWNSFIDMK